MNSEVCPVVHIHKVTDSTGNGTQVGVCPVNHGASNGVSPKPVNEVKSNENEIDISDITETPSLKEYRKIKKVMSMITGFYQRGSDTKKQNFDSTTEELAKLESDFAMVQAQIDALDLKPSFSAHPKRRDYRRDLLEEQAGLIKQRETFKEKQKEFEDLYEWSKGIVKVCQWLEVNVDHYCLKKLPDLPEKLKQSFKPLEELTQEQARSYAKGLDEIVYNLKESQDFFQASVDGRLKKYHNIEKDIIEAQLAAIRKFPEASPRRMYIEGELLRDLEYVENNMLETPEVMKRRQKMLKNHNEYFKVLMYNKEKLLALGGEFTDRKYDTKYDHYQED